MKKHLFSLTVIGLLVGVAFSFVSVNYEAVREFLKTAIFAEDIFALTNEEREQEKIGELQVDEKLTQAAQAKADDMAQKGYFAHTTPDGNRFFWWIDNVGYEYHYAGENLAVKFNTSEAAMRAWMESPGHKANILNDKFDEIGIGVADGMYQGEKVTFVVQMFGHEMENLRAVAEEKEQAAPAVPAVRTKNKRDMLFQLEIMSQGSWVTAGSSEKFIAVKKVATIEGLSELFHIPDILEITQRGGRYMDLFLGDTAPPMILQFLPL